MLEIFKNDKEKPEFVSDYQNPFQSDNIEKIMFTIEKSWWTDGKTTYRSSINFKTKLTTGTHRIDASSFTELIAKTESFVKSLSNQ